MIIKIFELMLFLLILVYLCIGQIPYYISRLHGDYPGPAEIYSNYELSNKSVDYLLIHGASVDSRIWQGVLGRNKNKSLVAISLGKHQYGVKYANPYRAANDIISYLKKHKVNEAIIGHSTASLWIAEAYHKCPECFHNVKIILLAPSFGNNILTSDITKLNELNKYSFILPNPMLNLNGVSSCEGGDGSLFNHCKKTYYYKRLFLFNSLPYYNDLVKYSLDANTLSNLDYFLKEDKANIIIYLSRDDKVLDPNITEAIAKQYHLAYRIVDNLSHIMVADDDKLWLHQ